MGMNRKLLVVFVGVPLGIVLFVGAVGLGLNLWMTYSPSSSFWTQLWLAAGALGTVGAVVLALLKDVILEFLFAPKLEWRLNTELDFGAAIVVDGVDEWDAHYLRLWVENKGERSAKGVHVMVDKVEQSIGGKKFQKIEEFLPMNLTWSHVAEAGTASTYMPQISPDTGRHCSVLEIIDPKYRQGNQSKRRALHKKNYDSGRVYAKLLIESRPVSAFHVLEPGLYRIYLKIAAENIQRTIPVAIEINSFDAFNPDARLMLRDGIHIAPLQVK